MSQFRVTQLFHPLMLLRSEQCDIWACPWSQSFSSCGCYLNFSAIWDGFQGKIWSSLYWCWTVWNRANKNALRGGDVSRRCDKWGLGMLMAGLVLAREWVVKPRRGGCPVTGGTFLSDDIALDLYGSHGCRSTGMAALCKAQTFLLLQDAPLLSSPVISPPPSIS